MSRIPPICPQCRRPPPSGTSICPTHGLHAVAPRAAAKYERAPLLGRVLSSRYAMLDVLGDGGMGMVYRGYDQRLDRPVAVKVLGALAALDEDDRARFEREAQALSRLRSEHTVTVYDFGVATQPALAGMAFIVLELVVGQDLFERIQASPLSPRDAAAVLNDVALSLDEAHRAGIIHRDVKPSNILLTTTPDGRRIAKVIDFGVARMEDGRRTRTGVMMGTPHYMAPEQCSGGRTPVDARTDVYALGAVLYEMLSGKPPFDGDQPMQILFKQVNSPVPPLPGSTQSGLRQRLEAAVHVAMAKDASSRFPSARALADEVTAAVAEAGVEAEQPFTAGAPTDRDLALSETIAPISVPTTDEDLMLPRRRWGLVALVGVAVFLGVVGALMLVDGEPSTPVEVAESSDEAPDVIKIGSPGATAPPVVPVVATPIDAGAPDAAPDAATAPTPAAPTGRKRGDSRGDKPTRRQRRTRRKPPPRPTAPSPPKKKPDEKGSDLLLEPLLENLPSDDTKSKGGDGLLVEPLEPQ